VVLNEKCAELGCKGPGGKIEVSISRNSKELFCELNKIYIRNNFMEKPGFMFNVD